MLAVTAAVSNAELVISLTATSDAAILRVIDDAYLVSTPFGSVGSFGSGSFNAIRVVGDAARPNQSLLIRPGGVVGHPLTVDSGVETTVIATPIEAIGGVSIASSSITLAANVTSSGPQTYGGTVRVAADITLDAGSSPLVFTSTISSAAGVTGSLLPDTVAFYRVAVNATGTFLFATDPNTTNLYRVDLATGGLSSFNVGMAATDLVVSPDGGTVYLANAYNNRVTVASQTGVVAGRVTVAGRPEGLALSPDGQQLYVANFTTGGVNVIDTSTRLLSRTIPVAAGLTGVAVSADGSRLWVASESTDSVYAVNPATNAVVATVAVGRGPNRMALSPDGGRLYVSNNYDDSLTVVDTVTAAVLATLPVGAGPTDVAVAPDGRRVFVVNVQSDTVSVIDAATRTVHTTIPVGSLPSGIAIAANGQSAYVANLDSISKLGTGARSLTVRTGGTVRFLAPDSTVDPLRALVVQATREIESAGTVVLTADTAGNLRAGGTQVRAGGGAVNYDSYRSWGWTARAAERVNNVNTVAWQNTAGELHFWRLDSNWNQLTADSRVAPGTAAFWQAERDFGNDFDRDGVIGRRLTVIEAVGSVALSYDSAGNLVAGETQVISFGAPVSFQTYVSWGWTATSAENVRGVNTIVWRNNSGSLHFWRLSGTWQHLSSDGMHAPGTAGYHAAEVDFATDFNGDGIIGAPETIIESVGSATLTYVGAGNLFVNGVPVTSGGNPVNFHNFAGIGYTAMAAEAVNGVNSIAWRMPDKKLHFWRLSSNWSQVSADSMMVPGAPRYHAAEVAFGRDFDDDGVIGSPFTIIEALGAVRLSYDRAGNLFANGTAITAGGAPVNYQSYASIGYTARAVETVDGVNTLAWVTTDRKIHYWRLSGSWAQTSSDSMIVPGKPRYLAAETTFGVDFDGDGRIGS